MGVKVLIVGSNPDHVRAAAVAAGLDVVVRHPDVVLCHGGDGTLLRAERSMPGIPKVPVRVGRCCHVCDDHRLDRVLANLAAGRLETVTLAKIELKVGDHLMYALNDVVLRNLQHTNAVRFRVLVDGDATDVITGDGAVVATPFGSSGYYRSITRCTVQHGLGVAFNNCTVARDPLSVDGKAVIRVELIRGPAALVCDNDARPIPLRDGHAFTVRLSTEVTVVMGLDVLQCQRCVQADGTPFNAH